MTKAIALDTTRRVMLINFGAIAAASAAAGAVTLPAVTSAVQPDPIGAFLDSNPDAELLALGESFERLWAAETAALARSDAAWELQSPDHASLSKAWEEASDATSEIVVRLARMEARTMAGVMLKVRAVLWCHCGDPTTIRRELEAHTTDAALGLGIAHDLAVMSSAGRV